ncbi:hypothetical protein [Hyphomicrobium sp. 99]|uniref:hypothetical protein n=1 Tax=Hyphomicrobium sp. 99 TaxID=1163419 RepID=UPI0012DFEB01|nr:hypothetical protein [Hyphomicrobium sp. 99]
MHDLQCKADPRHAVPYSIRHDQGPVKKDGPNVKLDVYSFMTTAPNALADVPYNQGNGNQNKALGDA